MAKLRSIELKPGTTDYLAVNSPRVAKLMRGNRLAGKALYCRGGTAKLGRWWQICGFMARSILWRVPGKKTAGDKIEFARPSTVMIHAEGEHTQFEGVKKIEIKKSTRPLKVVKF